MSVGVGTYWVCFDRFRFVQSLQKGVELPAFPLFAATEEKA